MVDTIEAPVAHQVVAAYYRTGRPEPSDVRQKTMCELFAGQDPQRYASVRRSLRLRGFVTSLVLERYFWEVLDQLSANEGLSTPQFISTLYDEVLKRHGEVRNFTSLLRVACCVYLAGGKQGG